jgi:hypothetical protein
MMMPPSTILEMQKFMHDELHEKRQASEYAEFSARRRGLLLGQVVRSLIGRPRRELESYCEADRIKSPAI